MNNNFDLKVNGTKLNLIKKNEILCMSIGKQKLYHLCSMHLSVEEEETAEDQKKNEVKINKEQSTKVKIQNKKENNLKEILASHTIQKKQIEEERLLLPMAYQTYPSCRMLIDICKNKNQSVEEIKQHFLAGSQKERTVNSPNFVKIITYASSAYHELYEQHLNNAKDIIMRLQPLSPDPHKQKYVLEKPIEIKRFNTTSN